jgi:hypothetical protein
MSHGAPPWRRRCSGGHEQTLPAPNSNERSRLRSAVNGSTTTQQVGWAAYRLALLEPSEATSFLSQAERSFVDALTRKTERPDSSPIVSAKFNLVLVMLCSGRFALASRECDSASELAATREPGLYRGLLGRAKEDVAEAIELWPPLLRSTHAHKVLRNLETRYSTPPTRVQS